MDINLDNIALELYGKLETRFPDVKIGDETGEVLAKKEDIPDARFFEFPYKQNGVVMGTITIKLDEDDGVVLQVGGDLVDSDVPGIFNFVRSMGAFANKRMLNFKIVNLEKSNLDKRDYEFQAKSKEETIMAPVAPVMESKFYGTSKLSYQDLGEARLIIKHTQPVNPDIAAGRTMHIESIYVENAEGERFKYPYKHLNGARALAEHLKHGGNPYDAIGKHITGLSEELASLRKFKGFVSRNEAIAESMGDIPNRVMERIEQVKEEVQKLQRKAYYETFAESFQESEEQSIPETMMNDWVDRLTIRTFNEELKSAFPYIYKLVSESDLPVRELNPEDILGEEESEDESDHFERGYNEAFEDSFESFINSITEDEMTQDGVNTLTSPNKVVQQAAIEKLNQIIAHELPGGPNGINAIESLKGIIDDPEFLSMLKDADPSLDTRPLIQQYVVHSAPEVAAQLKFGEGELGGQEPVAPQAELTPPPETAPAEPEAAAAAPAEQPAPEQQPVPVAESMSKLKAKLIRAKECGAGLDTELDFGHKKMTLGDAIRECGMEPEDIGFESDEVSGQEKMAEMVKSFWNDEENNFPIGGTRVKQKIVKAFKDGEFPDVSVDDVKRILVKIEQMDPSTGEQNNLIRLAGVGEPDIEVREGPTDAQEFDLDQIVGQLKALQANPDQAGRQIQQKIGSELQKVQGQVPNQNVQFPGGQVNPQDMMKALLQKINFGN